MSDVSGNLGVGIRTGEKDSNDATCCLLRYLSSSNKEHSKRDVFQ